MTFAYIITAIGFLVLVISAYYLGVCISRLNYAKAMFNKDSIHLKTAKNNVATFGFNAIASFTLMCLGMYIRTLP